MAPTETPPLPLDERARLSALHALDLLDTEPEAVFDTLTRLASTLLGTPIATVTLVDASRVWFKSRIGVPTPQIHRDQAICSYAILGDRPLLVEDGRNDRRFRDNPLVAGEAGLRAYAGVPLLTTDGRAIGVLCVIDRAPRRFTDHEVAILSDLARLATHEIRMRESTLRARRVASESLDAVSRSQGLYLAIFQHAAVGIAIIGLDGKWQRVNPTMCRILGRPAEQLANLTFQDVTHPDDLDVDLDRLNQLLDGHCDHYTLEKRYLRPDASIVWGSLTVTLVRDAEGRPLHFVSIVDDISARRAGDDALRRMQDHLAELVAERTTELTRANAQLEDLYRNAPCGYYSLDADGVFVQINDHSLRLFGATRESLIGKRSPREFLSEEGRRRFAEVYPRFMRDGHFGPEEFDLHGDDGAWRRVTVRATAIRDERGAFLRSRTVIFDVSELHRTRLALQAAIRQQHLMLDSDLFAIIKVRDRRFIWVNRAFEKLIGLSGRSLIGR